MKLNNQAGPTEEIEPQLGEERSEPMHARTTDVRVEVHVLIGDEADAGFVGEDALELGDADFHLCPPLIEVYDRAVERHDAALAPRRIAFAGGGGKEGKRAMGSREGDVCGDASRGFRALTSLARWEINRREGGELWASGGVVFSQWSRFGTLVSRFGTLQGSEVIAVILNPQR